MNPGHYRVFYAGQIYGEYGMNVGQWPGAHTLPDGCYLQMTYPDKGIAWYVHIGGGFSPINLADVPNELRVLTLLLT